MNRLAHLLSSRVKAEVFRLLFDGSARELHIREIGRRAHLADATIRQELRRLSTLGLVEIRRDGNRAYYRASSKHPLYVDIRNVVVKTTGLVDVLREALDAPDIRMAFVFGSVAEGTERAESDVDVMVIGDAGLRRVSALLQGVSERVGREVNPHVMTAEEFARRRRGREHFVASVMRSKRLMAIGDEDELEGLGG